VTVSVYVCQMIVEVTEATVVVVVVAVDRYEKGHC
jgi:hypothetical protein